MKDKFIYGRIDVEIIDHEKTLEVGEGAFGVYVAAICYCRKKTNNGYMTKAAALALIGGAGARHFDALVAIGWFVVQPDGRVYVWNYEKKNDTLEEIEASKAAVRERMKRHRDSARDTSRSTDVTRNEQSTLAPRAADVPSSSSSSLSESHSPEGMQGEADGNDAWGMPAATSKLKPYEQDYQRAFEKGFSAGRGGATYIMAEKHRPDLHRALVGHAKDRHGKKLMGADVLRWIEFTAREYAAFLTSLPEGEKRFWSPNPSGMLRWCNEVPVVTDERPSGIQRTSAGEKQVAGLLALKAVPR